MGEHITDKSHRKQDNRRKVSNTGTDKWAMYAPAAMYGNINHLLKSVGGRAAFEAWMMKNKPRTNVKRMIDISVYYIKHGAAATQVAFGGHKSDGWNSCKRFLTNLKQMRDEVLHETE